MEDILHGLRSEPYRRADAVRRSHRRRINSHRLSKGLEELDVWYAPPAHENSVRRAILAINANAAFPTDKKRRKDLEMVHKKHTISIYNIDDVTDLPKVKPSSYKVAPVDREVEERCELLKSTYDVISKYTRAMFDKQSETVVWEIAICGYYNGH